MESDPRRRARDLAGTYIQRGNPLGWFEALYAEAKAGFCVIPWADLSANRNLIEWLERKQFRGNTGAALVIGCGLGDDAEELARKGFKVTAFDISATAIDCCKNRFPASNVSYVVADLFAPPESWYSRFDFVLESYTLQVLPRDYRPKAISFCCKFVRPGGRLLLISRGREVSDNPGAMPWPLTRSEVQVFEKCGLREESFEDYIDDETPPVRRFRAVYCAST